MQAIEPKELLSALWFDDVEPHNKQENKKLKLT